MPDLEKYWNKIKRIAGQCAANIDIEDLKTSVESAKDKIDIALKAGRLLQKDSQVFEKLTKANEALGDVGEALGTAKDVCMDIKAIGQIHEAMKTLSTDLIINDPEKSAMFFGQIFTGFGRLCRYLPPPANQWGQFLEGAGGFFSKMAIIMNPEKNPQHREQWEQAGR